MAHEAVKIASFGFEPGEQIGGKYRVEAFLGGGLQGEVYRVLERHTRVRRAAKLFYPQQNQGGRTARNYAQRLDRLRDCPVVVQYHHAETLRIHGIDVTCLLSEYVEGILLSDFIAKHPCGDTMLRMMLYEAAQSLLTHSRKWSWLKAWGMRVAQRRRMPRAIVAVARRLALILHRMWVDGTEFRWSNGPVVAEAA